MMLLTRMLASPLLGGGAVMGHLALSLELISDFSHCRVFDSTILSGRRLAFLSPLGRCFLERCQEKWRPDLAFAGFNLLHHVRPRNFDYWMTRATTHERQCWFMKNMPDMWLDARLPPDQSMVAKRVCDESWRDKSLHWAMNISCYFDVPLHSTLIARDDIDCVATLRNHTHYYRFPRLLSWFRHHYPGEANERVYKQCEADWALCPMNVN